jgi:MFS family permease
MMIWSFGILGIYFFTSLYLQGNLGFSPTKAGLAFVPMALCLAAAAALSPRVVPVLGGHRTVALGMAVMTVGLVLFATLGASATFTSLLPGFILFGLGAGLMNVPLTNAILGGVPADRAGIAGALFNASREVAGLLGVTVVGAVLRSTDSAALRSGTRPAQAFIDGYHSGLWLTIGLLAIGVVLSYATLRPRPQAAEVATTGLEAAELGLAELVLGEPLEPLGDAGRGAGQSGAAEAGFTDGLAVPSPQEG